MSPEHGPDMNSEPTPDYGELPVYPINPNTFHRLNDALERAISDDETARGAENQAAQIELHRLTNEADGS